MKTILEQRVEEIKRKKAEEKEKSTNEEELKAQNQINAILEDFETEFAPELKILRESGIKWTAHHQDRRYSFMGYYIQFEKDGKTLKMDYYNRHSYRYEYIPYNSNRHGTMVFYAWPKDRFLIFVYDGLLATDNELNEEEYDY